MANVQTGTSQFFDLSIKQGHQAFDKNFFGHGKILLSGEYFVLYGADALALPTQAGQSLSVKYEQSFNPVLSWRAFNSDGGLWFEVDFEFWKFDILSPNKTDQKSLFLQKLLRQARIQNKHFLRDEQNVYVETRLGFPKDWGLGSSSSLIYNLAQWAYISPFELLFETSKGSGYDVACAQSSGAILYNLGESGPLWSPVLFAPEYKKNIYFVYLGRQQDTQHAIESYSKIGAPSSKLVDEVSLITREILSAKSFKDFNYAITKHEEIVSGHIGQMSVKERFFSDFNGHIKSLGAWGGDFIMASSDASKNAVMNYFNSKGHDIIIPFDQIILTETEKESRQKDDRLIH